MAKGKQDLSPIRLTTAGTPSITLVFRWPVEVIPFRPGPNLVAELPDLHIVASGRTREALIKDLQDCIVWIWREYGQADDIELSDDARKLKRAINDLVKEAQETVPEKH